MLCTVLVGNSGFRGISSIANEDGSDGTVRASTANMSCVRIRAAFPASPDGGGDGPGVEYELEPSSGATAFGVVEGHNHGTITLSHRRRPIGEAGQDTPDGDLLAKIVRGLTVADDGFEAWRQELEAGNRALLPEAPRRDGRNHGFQNTVVRVRDQYGVGVDDHLIEFYEEDHDHGDLVARMFHESAIRKVHKYSGDASHRSVYVDCTRLARTIDKVHEALSLSITAYPELDARTPVGFTTGSGGVGGVRIPRDHIGQFFAPHRTALVTLQLTRQQSERTFRFHDHRQER